MLGRWRNSSTEQRGWAPPGIRHVVLLGMTSRVLTLHTYQHKHAHTPHVKTKAATNKRKRAPTQAHTHTRAGKTFNGSSIGTRSGKNTNASTHMGTNIHGNAHTTHTSTFTPHVNTKAATHTRKHAHEDEGRRIPRGGVKVARGVTPGCRSPGLQLDTMGDPDGDLVHFGIARSREPLRSGREGVPAARITAVAHISGPAHRETSRSSRWLLRLCSHTST